MSYVVPKKKLLETRKSLIISKVFGQCAVFVAAADPFFFFNNGVKIFGPRQPKSSDFGEGRGRGHTSFSAQVQFLGLSAGLSRPGDIA